MAGSGPTFTQRDYLARTFLASGKRFENYIVNRVWHRLDDLELKPVTQQYVDRGDGTYALLDLYFPQLNVGIECDEAQHLATVDADLVRTRAVTESIAMDQKVGAVRAEQVTLIERVAATDDIESIHARIDEIVDVLRARKSAAPRFQAWDPAVTDTHRARDRGRVALGDDYFFRATRDIRPLFGLSAVTVQQALYRIATGDASRLWCIRLVDRAGASTASNDIENRVSADWTEIYERAGAGRTALASEPEAFDRIVFARSRNALGEAGYRFLGVFHKAATTRSLDAGAPFVVHKRMSDALDLRPSLT